MSVRVRVACTHTCTAGACWYGRAAGCGHERRHQRTHTRQHGQCAPPALRLRAGGYLPCTTAAHPQRLVQLPAAYLSPSTPQHLAGPVAMQPRHATLRPAYGNSPWPSGDFLQMKGRLRRREGDVRRHSSDPDTGRPTPTPPVLHHLTGACPWVALVKRDTLPRHGPPGQVHQNNSRGSRASRPDHATCSPHAHSFGIGPGASC